MAGVNRLDLDLSDLTISTLDPKMFIPAPAQRVLGYQIREDDTVLAEILQALNDEVVQSRTEIERSVLRNLDGGRQLPLGVYCDEEETVHVAFAQIGRAHV